MPIESYMDLSDLFRSDKIRAAFSLRSFNNKNLGDRGRFIHLGRFGLESCCEAKTGPFRGNKIRRYTRRNSGNRCTDKQIEFSSIIYSGCGLYSVILGGSTKWHNWDGACWLAWC